MNNEMWEIMKQKLEECKKSRILVQESFALFKKQKVVEIN